MFNTSENVLGIPQINVTLTSADFRKFLGQNESANQTTYMPYPGQVIRAIDPIYGESIFLSAFGLVGMQIGEAAVIGLNYAVTRAAAASRGVVGISMSPNVDPGALSWYCVQGQVPARLLAAGANLPLYSSGTTGSLTTTVVATQGITGAFSLTALAASFTTAPRVNTVNGSPLVTISDLAGLYVGAQFQSTTGITNGTTILAIGQGGQFGGSAGPRNYELTLSANATATGVALADIRHGAAFALAMIQYPFIAGAV